ncbi:MAG: recombination mediator RecR [Saprospiraceae bacterium]|jgi:recombination protein RecR
MNFSSKLIEQAVEAFSTLPGIGKKTALRLVLHLLKQPESSTKTFAEALVNMREGIRDCKRCHNLSDQEICQICADSRRDGSTICVVENIRDLMAIEDTGQFRGRYHVLGGLIMPIEGIGPEDLNLETLIARVQEEEVKEIIMAVSPTIEGETTAYYLAKKLQGQDVQISAIARGVSFGGELEYADELTLGRSIVARTPYKV